VAGVKRVLPIYLSDRVDKPMLAGILRPFIVLPGTEFTKTELHNILIIKQLGYIQMLLQ
jgi:beta-lactamase regulating signal transducer with metallopeptidase domain